MLENRSGRELRVDAIIPGIGPESNVELAAA